MRRQVSATLNEIITEARQLRDSLIVSGLSEFQRSVIQSALAGLRTDSITFAELNRQFNTGRTRLDVVSAKGAGELSPWQDTLINNLRLPVDIQSDTTTYYFSFHGFSDTLQVYYQRNISQTLDGMRMQLTGVGVNQQATSFDSLVVRCFGRICSNDRTTIFIYY